MAKIEISTKRLAISKANARMVAILGVASFISVFCLMAANAVWGQTKYQAKVIDAKEQARDQLEANAKAYDKLAASYKTFNGKETNVIGGKKDAKGDNDGDNAKIILNALPSSYDFPALTSSLEKILSDRGLKVSSITGTDDQLGQQGNASSPSPTPVDIPFTFSVSDANYTNVQELILALEHSIRPIQVDSLTLTGGASNMTLTVNAHTQYQPGKNVQITKKVVK